MSECIWWDISLQNEAGEIIGPVVGNVCKDHLVFEKTIQDNHIYENHDSVCIDSINVRRLENRKCPYVAIVHGDKVYLSRVEWWLNTAEINFGDHGKQRSLPRAKMIHIHFDDYNHADIGKWFARNNQGSAYAIPD